MGQTLKETRELVLARRTWNVRGDRATDFVNRAIGLALEKLSRELGSVVTSAAWKTRIYATVDSAAQGIEINATVDPVVLKITRTGGLPLLTWLPAVDGTWDASMWLEITTTRMVDGVSTTVYETRQSVEWFSRIENSGTAHYVTIDRPWMNNTDTALAFKIYQRHIWMPSEYSALLTPNSGQISSEATYYSCEIVTQAGDYITSDVPQMQAAMVPQVVFRDAEYNEQAPMSAPVCVTATTQLGAPVAWAGPWQEGDFEFYYTVCWGRFDRQWQQARGGINDILFESAPSPASATWKHSTTAGVAIKINTMNPDQMRNFFDSTKLSYGRSGRFIRLYVRRTAIRTAGLGTMNSVESDRVPYLLAEFDPTTTGGYYVWDGSVIPEFTRRLRITAGHYIGYRLYPYSDKTYDFTARLNYTPPGMLSDGDILPVNSIAYSLFLDYCEAHVARLDGSDDKSYNMIMARAEFELGHVRATLRGNQVMFGQPYSAPKSKDGIRIYQKIPDSFLL